MAMSVDELLAQQQEAKSLATIESVADKPELVKVTPWLRATGCLCSLSLVIPKSVIESVKPIGEARYCCGRRLEVVEITFVQGAQLPVTDLFSQAVASASNPRSPAPDPDEEVPSPFASRRPAHRRVPTIPGIIATYLAEQYAIDSVTGGIQCATAVQGILDHYDVCVDNGGSAAGCARAAARQIRDYACRSYCNCS